MIRDALSAVAASALISLIRTATILAASPSPDPATGGDPRSSGQGPGLVGDPAFALLAVIAIGLVAVAATLIYVRLTPRRDP